jgi:hypothetical protein
MIKPTSEVCSKILSYIDPGVGSIIIQLVIGVLAGSIYYVKVQWAKVKLLFKKLFKKNEQDT